MKKVLCFIGCLMAATSASATVIDFEELSHGQSVAYDHYASEGLLLDSGISWEIYNSSSYPKALINDTDWAGDLIGSFTSAVANLSIVMGDVCCDTDTGLLEVYDAGGNLLGSDYGSSTDWFTVSVDTASISSFRIFATGAVVYDSITFDADVPEPASLGLLALGLAGVGFGRKRLGKVASA